MNLLYLITGLMKLGLVARVARKRGLSEAQVRQLVEQNTDGQQFGFLGEARVNVLKLNLALDELS